VLLLWEVWHSMLKAHFQDQASPSELSGMELPLSLLDHDLYPDVVLRALSVLVPGLQQYWNGDAGVKFSRPTVDGGYYTRTPENLPLIGDESKRCARICLTTVDRAGAVERRQRLKPSAGHVSLWRAEVILASSGFGPRSSLSLVATASWAQWQPVHQLRH
jgi:hypothetical protein